MYVPCWSCGSEVWIQTQTECRHCGEVAKRCVDCTHFDGRASHCGARDVDVSEGEASQPHTLSMSYRCQEYHQSPSAAQRALARKASVAAKPAAPVAAPPAPAPAAAGARPTRKRPQVLAHRGFSSQYPENTVAALRKAAEMRCDGIEFDVQVTADGVPVVIHDTTLDRTTDGTGEVAKAKFVDLRSLSAGAWLDPRFAHERVPTLSEAIQAASAPSFLNVHVKCHENDSDRAERAIVSALRESGALKRCWVTHHTRHGLHRFRELEPNLRLCWLPRDDGSDLEYIDEAFYMGFRMIQPSFRAVTPEFVAYAHEKKVWINVFWADDEETMRSMAALGVDGILTNCPDKLQEVLGVRRAATAAGGEG